MKHSTWCHLFLEYIQILNINSNHHDSPFEPDWFSLGKANSDPLDPFYEWHLSTMSDLSEPKFIDNTYDYITPEDCIFPPIL